MPALTPEVGQLYTPPILFKGKEVPPRYRIDGCGVYALGVGALVKGNIPSKFDNPIRNLVKIMSKACQLTRIIKWINKQGKTVPLQAW